MKAAPGAQPSVLIVHPGAELYGSDRVLLDSALGLANRGWEVTAALPERGPLVDDLEAAGVKVVPCRSPVLRKNALRPRGIARLVLDTLSAIGPGFRLLGRIRPDLLYVSTVTIPLWMLLARLRRIPVVCHVHEAETAAPGIVRKAMAVPLKMAMAVLINSSFSRDVLLAALPSLSGRSSVIPNPVPGPARVLKARETLSEPIRVLFVGRLSPRKGPQVALASIAELRSSGLEVCLDLLGAVFPGYEWFEKELRQYVATNDLTTHVRFLGFRPDVWPTMERADIVVIPSVADEPFGNTAVEAVLAARPVVASASGGLVEAVGRFDCARLCDRDDPVGLAGAIQDVIEDWPTIRERAFDEAGVAAVIHDPERYRARIDRELRDLLRRRR